LEFATTNQPAFAQRVEMDSSGKRSDGFAMAVVVEGGLALAAVVAAWIFRVSLRDMFPALGEPLVNAIVRGLLATLPMLVIFWLLVNSEWPMMRQLREQVQWLIDEMFPSRSIAQFAMVAILAGVGEELLFRGALQSILGNWTSPVVGLVLTSLLFGLAHALSKLYFLFAVAVGAFLGWMTLKYNDLVAPMVAHGVYDFLALVYLSRQKPQPADESQPINNE
jgi:membrane protease YdiL (CAAX protease family)